MPEPNVIPPYPREDEDWWTHEAPLQELLATHTDPATLDAAKPLLETMGTLAPTKIDAWARTADKNPPQLEHRSPTGERIDHVTYHPAYEELQRAAREHGAFTLPWHSLGDADHAPRTIAFALGYLYAQAECGYYCPACMTDGAAFVLDRHAPEPVKDRYVPGLTTNDPDDALEGAMYLTEKQGGSDVGTATHTTAQQAEDGSWRLTGEKWFASNCTADLALALARMPTAEPDSGTRGLGLFALPRTLPDGTPNPGIKIARLKDKLGVKSMATGEIVLDRAYAKLVKDAPDGFKAMAEMVNLSRLYNAVTSVAIARRALREGQRAGTTRETFGKPLHQHPLFQRDLLELALDTEGALAFILDTADVFDAWAHRDDEDARRTLRLLTPLAKAVTGKLAVKAASEGCELLGGQGYIEEYVTPRLLRDAQVLPIWEGTTNIQALDLLRVITRENALEAFQEHAYDRIKDASEHAPTKPAVRHANDALEHVRDRFQELQGATPQKAQAASKDLLWDAFHAHATGLLARAAAHHAPNERRDAVANLYAARHLAQEREAREAMTDAVGEDALAIAYPDHPDM